jgi:hypothetical protein
MARNGLGACSTAATAGWTRPNLTTSTALQQRHNKKLKFALIRKDGNSLREHLHGFIKFEVLLVVAAQVIVWGVAPRRLGGLPCCRRE